MWCVNTRSRRDGSPTDTQTDMWSGSRPSSQVDHRLKLSNHPPSSQVVKETLSWRSGIWCHGYVVWAEILKLLFFVVYYESIKREIQRRLIYECRCDERLKTKTEESARLTDTVLVVVLEHLKIKTRLIDKKFASVRGECEIYTPRILAGRFFYFSSVLF